MGCNSADDDFHQRAELDGLHQMAIDARGGAALPIRILTVSCERHDSRLIAMRHSTDPASDFEPVDPR